MSTITGTVTNGVTLGQAGYTSPLKITGGGTVSNSTGAAVYASGTYANPVVVNHGTIIDTAGFDAVELKGGGSVANTALIQGYTGVDIFGAVATVTNSGTITGTGQLGFGVFLGAGGSVANTGLIQQQYGFGVGVEISGAAGTVTNSGTIGVRSGLALSAGGSVDNTGLIEGRGGVVISGGAGTVTNSGTISGLSGVALGAGGSVANTGLIEGFSGVYIFGAAGTVTNSGTIVGLSGVVLGAGGTVVDSGTITGGGTAISFGGTGGNLLVLEHGYELGGGVSVAGTANTLELLGTAGPVTVDFDKPGAGFTNFDTVAFGAASGNKETLTITDTAALPGTISGFSQLHDSVDLTQLSPKGATATLNGGNHLVVSNGSQSVSLQLDPSENYSGVVWKTNPDGKGGTDATVQKAGASSFGFDDISGVPAFAGGANGPPTGVMPVSEDNGGASLFPPPGGGMPAVIDPTLLHGTPLG